MDYNIMTSFKDDFYDMCDSIGADYLIVYDAGYGIIRYSYNEVRELCGKYIALFKKYNIKWFDNQTIEEFTKNDDYFKNLSHLNKKGASAYTSYIISQIKDSSTVDTISVRY